MLTHFPLVLPIACVDGLREGVEGGERGGLPDPHDIILDTLR
jgi:hypothetical protein